MTTMTLRLHKEKCFAIFGKVFTKNTRWLLEDALILKNARINRERLDILDRTRDDTVDRLQDTLVDRATEDDINECPSYKGHSVLYQLLPERHKS